MDILDAGDDFSWDSEDMMRLVYTLQYWIVLRHVDSSAWIKVNTEEEYNSEMKMEMDGDLVGGIVRHYFSNSRDLAY